MTVEVIGGSEREQFCAEYILNRGELSMFSRVVVLPIPTTRDGIVVNGTTTDLSELSFLSGAGTLFCSYGLPLSVAKEIERLGGVCADVCEDGEFCEKNAALTAECTLSYIMSHSKKALGELKIGIVGYGRIGSALLELLLFHGSDVTVYTRKSQTQTSLNELGVKSVLVPEADLSGLDVLVNTAPARIFSRAQLEKTEGEVLEIAPGDNLPFCKKLTRLPSLPAKMLPESSGRLYAETVIRTLKRGQKVN